MPKLTEDTRVIVRIWTSGFPKNDLPMPPQGAEHVAGHASVEIPSKGTYASLWPKHPNKLEDLCKFHDFKEDTSKEGEGRAPEIILNFYSLDVDAMKRRYDGLYSTVKVWRVVDGAILSLPFKSFDELNKFLLEDRDNYSCVTFALVLLWSGEVWKLYNKAFWPVMNNSFDPDDLARKLIKAKEKELSEHPETEEFDKQYAQGPLSSNCIWALEVLPNGNLASGSTDGKIRLWYPNSGECFRTLPQSPAAVLSLAMLPKKGILASGYFEPDCKIRLWDVNSWNCLHTLEGHVKGVRTLAVLPNETLVSGSYENSIRLWNVDSGQCLRTLRGQNRGAVFSLAALPNGNLASGSDDGRIRLWNPDSGECFRTLRGSPPRDALSLAALSDEILASGEEYGKISLWNLNSGECFCTFGGLEEGGTRGGRGSDVMVLKVLPNGTTLAAGLRNGRIGFCDLLSKKWFNVEKHGPRVQALALLNGKIISGSFDGSIRIWPVPKFPTAHPGPSFFPPPSRTSSSGGDSSQVVDNTASSASSGCRIA